MPAVSRPAIFILVLSLIGALLPRATPKSTIEPCSNSDSCTSLVGYTLYTDLKVSEVASIFSVDPISLLLANAIDISYPDVENHILPSQLFLKIPIPCSCVDGIRKSSSVSYKTRPPTRSPPFPPPCTAGLCRLIRLSRRIPMPSSRTLRLLVWARS
ncbi:UNVERIFIED_CONTAM: LysM domain-containing GPI-anchored protein 1 [Sesamum latifolium]|uniref:LysM domain-containing GPI-anchored protein 1 n=1 Tax=Sesamum latifolium TaxID=2727402 RepID=A0AAW2WD46_9LAMI